MWTPVALVWCFTVEQSLREKSRFLQNTQSHHFTHKPYLFVLFWLSGGVK